MKEAPAGTTAESASKIMGRACITLNEVLEIFPEAKAWVNPKDYEYVPYSQKLLFHLSGHPSGYILFPAIPYRGESGFVNLYEFEDFIKKRFPIIKVDTRALYRTAVYSLNNQLCPQKWYLISSRVLKMEELASNKTMGNLAYRIERSLVYLYAWALFRRLRGRVILKGRHFICSDFFSTKRQTNIVIFLNYLDVAVHELNRELKPLVGKIPSILPLENKNPD